MHWVCNGVKGNRDNDAARQIIQRKIASGEWVLMNQRRSHPITAQAA